MFFPWTILAKPKGKGAMGLYVKHQPEKQGQTATPETRALRSAISVRGLLEFWDVKCITQLNLYFIGTKFQLRRNNTDVRKNEPS